MCAGRPAVLVACDRLSADAGMRRCARCAQPARSPHQQQNARRVRRSWLREPHTRHDSESSWRVAHGMRDKAGQYCSHSFIRATFWMGSAERPMGACGARGAMLQCSPETRTSDIPHLRRVGMHTESRKDLERTTH